MLEEKLIAQLKKDARHPDATKRSTIILAADEDGVEIYLPLLYAHKNTPQGEELLERVLNSFETRIAQDSRAIKFSGPEEHQGIVKYYFEDYEPDRLYNTLIICLNADGKKYDIHILED